MPKPYLHALCIITASLCLVSTASADEESRPFTATVSTQSISPTVQVGTIELQIGHKKPNTCSIVGQIVGQDPATGALKLQHQVTCAHGTFSSSDTAVTTGMIDQCTLTVVEQNRIVSGTGNFKGVTGSGTATGTINVCTGQNSFSLSGTLSMGDDD